MSEKTFKPYKYEPSDTPEIARINVILQVFGEMENDREILAALNYFRARFWDAGVTLASRHEDDGVGK